MEFQINIISSLKKEQEMGNHYLNWKEIPLISIPVNVRNKNILKNVL